LRQKPKIATMIQPTRCGPAASRSILCEPTPKAQRNLTDPNSRIMLGKDGFIQAYNGQAAVDANARVIVPHSLSNSPMRLAWFR
jgi:hypothetical protein